MSEITKPSCPRCADLHFEFIPNANGMRRCCGCGQVYAESKATPMVISEDGDE